MIFLRTKYAGSHWGYCFIYITKISQKQVSRKLMTVTTKDKSLSLREFLVMRMVWDPELSSRRGDKIYGKYIQQLFPKWQIREDRISQIIQKPSDTGCVLTLKVGGYNRIMVSYMSGNEFLAQSHPILGLIWVHGNIL